MAVCRWCDQEMLTAASCTVDAFHQGGRRIELARGAPGADGCGTGAAATAGCVPAATTTPVATSSDVRSAVASC